MNGRWRFGEQETTVSARAVAGEPGAYEVTVDGRSFRVHAQRRADGGLWLGKEGGGRTVAAVTRDGQDRWVTAVGRTYRVQPSHRDTPRGAAAPGALEAPMPGKVVRVLVEDGDVVAAGDRLMVVEAMKMEHALTAPHGGVVTGVHATEGVMVKPGVVLVSIAEEAP